MLETNKRPSRTRRRVLAAWILLGAAGLAVLMFVLLSREPAAETGRGELEGRWPPARTLTIGDSQFDYRAGLENLLVMGIDRTAPETAAEGYRNNGQVDFLLLVTVDDRNRTVRTLQIDRDTVTDVTVLSVLGRETGKRPMQISLAHSFGATRSRNSELTVKAVEGLLGGVPITRYVSIGMGDVGAIADALGGIPVTVPEDMTDVDPSFSKGASVTLAGDLANRFVRQRYAVGDGSNASRMGRHRVFMDALQARMKQAMNDTPQVFSDIYKEVSHFLFTNSAYDNILALLLRAKDYRVIPVTTIPGSVRIGENGLAEFRPDPKGLEELVKNTFGANP